jgi:hypothetical protein
MAERTEIIRCNCQHEEQDKLYGKGMRVHNVNKKGQAACTVCCPSRRRNKSAAAISANQAFGHGFIPAAPSRNLKNVPI